MKLTQKQAFEKMAVLFKRNTVLCAEIFDEDEQMQADVLSALLKISDVLKNKLAGQLENPKIKDVVIWGDICTYFANQKTPVELAIIVETPLSSKHLNNIYLSFMKRGFAFFVKKHRVYFSLKKAEDVGGANYSLLRNGWNLKPILKDFSFGMETFYTMFKQLNKEVEIFVSSLEKDGPYLTFEASQKLNSYLDELQKNASLSRRDDPEHEYALTYTLFLCLKLFGTYGHFRAYANRSGNYQVNKKGNSFV